MVKGKGKNKLISAKLSVMLAKQQQLAGDTCRDVQRIAWRRHMVSSKVVMTISVLSCKEDSVASEAN